MTNFKLLKVWIKGMLIAKNCFSFSNTIPPQLRFTLGHQITRASVSIPSNIAEGSSRNSQKDYCRYIEIALGSSFELETQILLTESAEIGDSEIRKVILYDLNEEQKMLRSFMLILRSKNR
ncbi:MAG: four helix bundle protein [Flavisolibacter sp.]